VKKETKNRGIPKNYFHENLSGNQLDKVILNLLKNHNSDEIKRVLKSKSKNKSRK
jgi:hypothetical protein